MILGYLLKHPGAKDTIDGLTEWWLLERRVAETRREVEEAVDELVELGVLESTQHADGRVVYALRPDSQERAEHLLDAEEV
ncbi:MAG: hypothetical protein KC933_15990 [Myxococcales bacterium]|nr:hypothetical protein [Myxococcales bacterium]MCB9648401.1 hypothetical protein [Deltaproteobacteria bacterium]